MSPLWSWLTIGGIWLTFNLGVWAFVHSAKKLGEQWEDTD